MSINSAYIYARYRIRKIWESVTNAASDIDQWSDTARRAGYGSIGRWAKHKGLNPRSVRKVIKHYYAQNRIPTGRREANIFFALRALENPDAECTLSYPKSDPKYWSDVVERRGHSSINAWAVANLFPATVVYETIRRWRSDDSIPPGRVNMKVFSALYALEHPGMVCISFPKSDARYWSLILSYFGYPSINAWAVTNGYFGASVQKAIRSFGDKELPAVGKQRLSNYRAIMISLRDLEARYGA